MGAATCIRLGALTCEHIGQHITLTNGTDTWTDRIESVAHTRDTDGNPVTQVVTARHWDGAWPSHTLARIDAPDQQDTPTRQGTCQDDEQTIAEAIWEGVHEGGPTGHEFTGSLRRQDADYLARLALAALRPRTPAPHHTTTKD